MCVGECVRMCVYVCVYINMYVVEFDFCFLADFFKLVPGSKNNSCKVRE